MSNNFVDLVYINNMMTLNGLLIHILEGIAVTLAIYMVTKKSLQWREMIVMSLTISVTFIILDLFAPGVASGARQGSGFGLGFTQVAGNGTPMPREFYESKQMKEGMTEGMDDRVAIDYYSKLNPSSGAPDPQQPSPILQEFTKNITDVTNNLPEGIESTNAKL